METWLWRKGYNIK